MITAEEILRAAEKMVSEFPMVVVRSKPLLNGLKFVASIDDCRELSEEVRLLLHYMNKADWSYFPDEELDSKYASVNIYDMMKIKEQIINVKKQLMENAK